MSKQAQITPSRSTARMPVVFAAHGAPVLLDDREWMDGAFTKRSVQFG